MNLVYISGRAVQGPGFQTFLSPEFGMEILYSFVIILCSLMIYFTTKELYELSSHKGIKYFRLAFLFFAISYAVRPLIKFAFIYLIPEFMVRPEVANHLSLAIFIYFSVMSMLFLLYSVMYRKWSEKKWVMTLLQFIAVLIAFATPISTDKSFLFTINLGFLAVVLFVGWISYKESKKKKGFNLFAIYALLSAFLVFNLLDILVPNFFSAIQLLIYIFSIGIFMAILYKVLTLVGGK